MNQNQLIFLAQKNMYEIQEKKTQKLLTHLQGKQQYLKKNGKTFF